MTLQARTLLNLLAGALAGFLGWVVIDVTGWFGTVLNAAVQVTTGSSVFWELLALGGIYGLMVGLLLGVVDAIAFDSDEQRLRAVGLGALIGAAGGILGIALGQTFWALLAPANAGTMAIRAHPVAYLQEIVARSLGWALIGAGVGGAQGASRWSRKIFWQGLFGGAVGGLVGGVAFEGLEGTIGLPALSRLIGFVLIGAAIGFFIGLIQNIFKQAWIRVVVGRNEGKEYLIAKPVTTIGRSELADIGLFGDKAVAPTHCVIEMSGARYRLRPTAQVSASPGRPAFAPTVVNGMPAMDEVWLADGDTILIAGRTLQFHERVQARQPADAPAEGERPLAKMPEAAAEEEILRPVPSVAYTPPGEPAPTAGARASAAHSPADKTPLNLAGTQLTCLEGPHKGEIFTLKKRPMTVGRGADRDLALVNDDALSRYHFKIAIKDGRHTILDVDSANGTFVNEAPLVPGEPTVLKVGDFIRAGRTILKYE